MKRIALAAFLCLLTVMAAPAQVTVGGGSGAPAGIPDGAVIWYGASLPANTVGGNGDYYVNTTSYCLYGPKSGGAWAASCVSSVRQLGYIAEYIGSKGAPGGYAPLDSNALVPAVNLPPITAVNGTSVPGNNASDQTLITTASAVGAWTSIPSCPDTGYHLNYSLVTHGFLCGNTGGTAGAVQFSGVGNGTNANALLVSGTLGYTGGGKVNANQLSGVPLAGLSTGLLKITTGSGAPSIAASSDVSATLGFTPENAANKGAVNGYAPLNSSLQIPLTNLPAIPYTQTSGVQAALGFTPENTVNKNGPNGYAPLDGNRLVPAANLPAITTVNGTSVPVNTSSDQTVVTTAPAVSAWTSLPSCPDTGGNHLNYSATTHGFLCGNTGGTVGSVGFGGVGTGTNSNSLLIAGSLSYTGAGQVNANQLGGVSLSGLSTGLLKIMNGTGVPGTAVSADVSAALGFAPENPANRGAANGYAPLDASGLLPAANLPASTITAAALNSGTLSANVIGLSTTSDVTAGGNLNAAGNVYANATSPAPGCVHLSDANGTHDMGICAPGSGFNGLLNLPMAAGVAGQVLGNDGAGNLLWSAPPVASIYGRNGAVSAQTGDYAANQVTNAVDATQAYNNPAWITGLAWSKLTGAPAFATVATSGSYSDLSNKPVLAGDVTGPLGTSTVGAIQGRVISATAPANGQTLVWSGTQWQPGTVSGAGLTNPGGTPPANTPLLADGGSGDRWATDTILLGSAAVSTYHDPASIGHNVFVGDSAGNRTLNIGGGSSGNASQNIGIGYQALQSLTQGSQNVAIGSLALSANTTGQQNVAIGASALQNNTTGSWNYAFGQQALGLNTTGYNNFAFGLRALYQNTTGYNNAAFGIDAVGINQTGYRNSGFGVDSCAWIVTGYENSCMGMNTVWSGTTGYDNTGVGFNAMFGVTSGHYNTGVGAYADYYYPNTMIGTTLTLAPGTNLSVGWYWYKVSFVLNGQETALSNNSYLGILTTTGNQAVSITGIPTYSGPFTATARKIYRTPVCPTTICSVITANQMPRHWYYAGTISDNTTTTYLDTTADSSLGTEESSTPSFSIALGAYATVYKSSQMAVGGDPSPIYEIWLGNGVASATGPAGVQVASSGGSGTNAAGEDLTLAGGPGTGSAPGGNLIHKFAPSGSSGSAWNSLVESFRFSNTGAFKAAAAGTLDMSGAAHTTPAKTGLAASKPAACTVGEVYFATDATAGQNSYYCTAANTWTQQQGGGGALASVFGRTGAVVATAGDYSFSQISGIATSAQLPAAGGDLNGSLTAATVAKIQSRTISSAAPSDGQALVWSAASSQWQPGSVSSGSPINTVFGRTGSIVAAGGDYTAAQVTNAVDSTQSYASPSWLTAVTFGGTTLGSTGGTIYNNAGSGYTQLIFKDSSSQAAGSQAQILLQNNAGANVMFLGASSGFASGDGTNWKTYFSGVTQAFSNDGVLVWHNLNNAFSGVVDTGIARENAGVLKITDGSSGYGTLDAGAISVNGSPLAVTGDVTGALGATTVGKIQGRAVSVTAPADQQALVWSAANSQWQPAAIGGAAVSSVFGRTGVITAQTGDYTAAQVTNAVNLGGSYTNPLWLKGVAFGGTNLGSTGGTIYNNGASGNTQVIIQNSSQQSANGAASMIWKNNAGGNLAFINWDGGYAWGDGTNYKGYFSGPTVTHSSDTIFVWKNQNNAFSGSIDTGFARGNAGVLKVTNGSNGYGTVDAGGYNASGVAGVTGTTCTQWTNGICTHL